jgi:hypothetical protein
MLHVATMVMTLTLSVVVLVTGRQRGRPGRVSEIGVTRETHLGLRDRVTDGFSLRVVLLLETVRLLHVKVELVIAGVVSFWIVGVGTVAGLHGIV